MSCSIEVASSSTSAPKRKRDGIVYKYIWDGIATPDNPIVQPPLDSLPDVFEYYTRLGIPGIREIFSHNRPVIAVIVIGDDYPLYTERPYLGVDENGRLEKQETEASKVQLEELKQQLRQEKMRSYALEKNYKQEKEALEREVEDLKKSLGISSSKIVVLL